MGDVHCLFVLPPPLLLLDHHERTIKGLGWKREVRLFTSADWVGMGLGVLIKIVACNGRGGECE